MIFVCDVFKGVLFVFMVGVLLILDGGKECSIVVYFLILFFIIGRMFFFVSIVFCFFKLIRIKFWYGMLLYVIIVL